MGGQKPQFARELNNLSIVDTGLRHYYLTRKRGQQFDETIYYEMGQDPTLSRFTPKQRHEILEHWATRANGAALRSHVNKHPEITGSAWYYNGLSWAAQGNYAKAMESVQPYVAIPRLPEFTYFSTATENELRKAILINPEDIVRGSILLKRQIDKKDWIGAHETAGILNKAEPNLDYASFWKGEMDRRAGFAKDAWEAWLPYLKVLEEESRKRQLRKNR